MPSEPMPMPWSIDEMTAGLVSKLGIEFDDLTPERTSATMPVEGNTQPYGILHGGATCTLVETLASFGAAIAAGPSKIVMGQTQTTSFLSTATEGSVRGVATPLHVGRTTHVWNVDVVHAGTGRLVASGRVTLAVRERRD